MGTCRDLAIDFAGGGAGTASATWGQHAIWDVLRTLGAEAPQYNASVSSCFVGYACFSCMDCPLIWLGSGRFGLGWLRVDGLVRNIALSLSHTAVDAWGLRRLALNMAAVSLGESVDQLAERLPSMQPRAEADFQASERGRRLDAHARQHWLRKLRLSPERLFSDRVAPADLPFPHAVLNSPALAVAVQRVAAGHQVSSSTVVLAAASVMVSRLSGSPDVVFLQRRS